MRIRARRARAVTAAESAVLMVVESPLPLR
jgi:hypothetical protein